MSWVVTLQALYLSVYPSLVLYDTYSGTAFITLSIGPQAWTPIGLQEANLLMESRYNRERASGIRVSNREPGRVTDRKELYVAPPGRVQG